MKNIFKITIILLSISFMAFKTYRAKLLPQTSVTKLNTKDIVVIKTEPTFSRSNWI